MLPMFLKFLREKLVRRDQVCIGYDFGLLLHVKVREVTKFDFNLPYDGKLAQAVRLFRAKSAVLVIIVQITLLSLPFCLLLKLPYTLPTGFKIRKSSHDTP